MKNYLRKLSQGEVLTEEETFAVFEALLKKDEPGAVTDAQIGAYLFATGCREPRSAELVGAARSLRAHMIKVDLSQVLPGIQVLDTCGTGGSGLNTFNTSTVVALVCAAAGQPVAKHGNRGATSSSGSMDLLEALGVKCDLTPEHIAFCCKETNFCFMFAPKHHPATARVARIRRELGFRTIFNFLGPLVNPADAAYQLLGVSKRSMVPVIAQALRALGAKRAMVVHGDDGQDEITLCGETLINEVKEGEIREYSLSPGEFGFGCVQFEQVKGSMPAQAAERVREILSGKESPYRDLILINAGAALYLCGRSKSIAEGIAQAKDCLDSNKAMNVLNKVIEETNRYA
jgi:anthranilate phosphoribosyltransferase